MDLTTTPSFSIIHIPRNEDGYQKYLEEYKALRLFSLKTNPESFHSTYAGELAFADDVWHKRLANPFASTFVAINKSGKMVCMTTLTGPLDYGPHELPVLGVPMSCLTEEEILEEGRSLHYRLNAVFTHPEARRKGVAKSVIETAISYITEHIPLSKKEELLFSVIVELGVPEAKSLYEKCGFVETKRIHKHEKAYLTNIAILECGPAMKPVVSP